MEGYCFSAAVNADLTWFASDANVTADTVDIAPAVTTDNEDKLEIGTLIWASGYLLDANNGLHVLSADAASTDAVLTCAASTLADETAPANAEISVCGFRAAAADMVLDVTAGVATLTSTTSVPDWAALGLTLGQQVHLGGVVAANQFDVGGTAIYGFGRIKSIASNVMTLDKLDSTLATSDGVGDTIDVLFGRFVRNVNVDHADFLERYFQFEASFPNLFETTPPTPVAEPDGYEYALDNLCDSFSMSMSGQSLATLTVGFIGTDTETPVDGGSRKTNADSARQPLLTEALNTAADFARLRITDVDETGLTTDFKDLKVNFNNGVSPDKVLGQLAAKFLNTGNFKVGIEAECVFTEPLVVNRIRNNTTVSMDFILENADGAGGFDIPSMTITGGGKDFPVNESVKIKLTGMAYQDPTLGTSIGVSFFPVTPTSYAA
jgi:hypothetical protein